MDTNIEYVLKQIRPHGVVYYMHEGGSFYSDENNAKIYSTLKGLKAAFSRYKRSLDYLWKQHEKLIAQQSQYILLEVKVQVCSERPFEAASWS